VCRLFARLDGSRLALTSMLVLVLGCTPEREMADTLPGWGGVQTTGSSGDGAPSPDEGGDGDSGTPGEDGGSGASGGSDADEPTGDDDGATDGNDDGASQLDPPEGESSGGSGGGAANGAVRTTDSGVQYHVIAPGGSGPFPLMIVYSGLEGGGTMTSNMSYFISVESHLRDAVVAVLDGETYYGNGQAGADVLDDVRALWNIDNDRTWLLSESAGTSAGLELGLRLRQSYFAAFWANDVNARALPAKTAAELGFAPWGNAGPGGRFADADYIVDGMRDAGYRLEEPAPYDGPGAGQHGSQEQFEAAIRWYSGRSRL
jgi:hypothetical protein